MLGDELKKFISGRDDIDFNRVSKDLEMLLYSTARKLNRKLDRECVSELLSQFIFELWQKKSEFPLPIDFCYLFATKLVYSAINQSRLASTSMFLLDRQDKKRGYQHPRYFYHDLRYEFDPRVEPDFTFPKEDVIGILKNLHLHAELSSYLINIIETTEVDTLMDIMQTGTLLGDILVASFLSSFNLSLSKDNRDIFPFTSREEEVMLGCTLVKINKKWVIPTYILMRDGLFLTVMSFMDSVLAPNLNAYFRNLLLSVKVYCVMEHYRKDRSEDVAVRDCGHRFDIRFRDVKNRTGRIERLFIRYDQRVKQIITTIERNLRSFYRL